MQPVTRISEQYPGPSPVIPMPKSLANLFAENTETAPSESMADRVLPYEESAPYFLEQVEEAIDKGHYEAALSFNNQALKAYGKLDASSIVTRQNILDNRVLNGRLLGFLGCHQEAIESLLESFQENSVLRTITDPKTIELFQHLGWHLSQFAQHDGTSDDLDSFKLLFLGSCLESSNQERTLFSLAQDCYAYTLSHNRSHLGEWDLATATSWGLMGWLCVEMENYEDALKYCQQALKIRLQQMTLPNPVVAKNYATIGICHEKLGNYEEAVKSHQQALEMRLEILSFDHPDLIRSNEHIERVRKANLQ